MSLYKYLLTLFLIVSLSESSFAQVDRTKNICHPYTDEDEDGTANKYTTMVFRIPIPVVLHLSLRCGSSKTHSHAGVIISPF